MPHIDTYLEEFLRHEGLGDYDTTVCPTDGCIHPALYCCRDCHDDRVYCKDCIVTVHHLNPYHHVLVRYIIFLLCSLLKYFAVVEWLFL